MKNAVKGALFSGLVFPGTGQMVLKHYARGLVILLPVVVCLIYIIVKAIQQALAVLEKLTAGGGLMDIAAISRAAVETSTTSGSRAMEFCLILILIAWVLGTLDAYWIGHKLDQQRRMPPEIP